MAIYNAGNAYLQILPSFRGIEKLMQKETAKLARAIDKSTAAGISESVARAFQDIDTDKVSKGGKDAGDKWANNFERQVAAHLKDLAKDMPTFEPKADLDKFDQALQKTRKEILELSKTKLSPGEGGGGIDTLGHKLEEITTRMHQLADEAENADKKVQLQAVARRAQGISNALSNAAPTGESDGRLYGGAFAAEAKKKIEAALRDLPEVNVDADTSGATREIAELRERLVALGDKKIGIDIDHEKFTRDLATITSQLESFARNPKPIGLKYDVESAARGLRDFTDKVSPVLDQKLAEVGRNGGEAWGGAYAEAVQERVRRAAQALPNLPVSLDDSDAARKLAAIRQQLLALSDKKLGVNIDTALAEAQLRSIKEQLRALDGDNISIDIKTNALTAAAQLGAIDAATKQSTGSMQSFSQGIGITMSRLGYLVAIGSSLGSLVAPAAAAAAVAIGGMGAAAAGAVAGFGVLALGLTGIGDAVKKIDAYQQDANKSAHSFSAAQNGIINATEQVRDAERNLAYTRQDAAEAAVAAQDRIADAIKNVGKAQRDAAEAVKKAREQEREAVKDLSRARKDAAEAIASAIENEEDAERSATDAVKDQKEAREDLSRAMKDAVADLRELQTALKRNQLDIDEATTAAMKAKQELDKLMSNPRATEVERRMALEAYQDKVIQIEELKNKQQELRKEQAAADKEGVESTDRVKKARKAVADADDRAAKAARSVADARKAVDKARLDATDKIAAAEHRVADAQAATQKAQRDGAERVAAAQEAVADAQKAAAKQQRDAQRQIAAGVEAVSKAQRGLAQASEAAGVAGGDAFDSMNDSLKKLSPAGQAFAHWLYSLKPLLDQLRQSAQQGLLPGLQAGLQTLLSTYFPAFDRFVSKIAQGMGDMFKATGTVLTDPKWRQFFGFIDQTALPAMQGLWVMSLNVARGVANLVRNIAPLAAPLGKGLVELTERFARWSDNLENDNGFREFAEYAARVGPKVVQLFEELVNFVGRLVIAAAPLGEFLLDTVTNIVGFINSWDIDTLSTVVDIVAILGTTIWALSGFVKGVKLAIEIWNTVSKIAEKVQGLLAGAVDRFQASTVGATTSTGLLNGALGKTGGAARAGAAGLGAMEALAGPLGLALLAIGGAWLVMQHDQQKAEDATDELGQALDELGESYRAAGDQAASGSAAVEDGFRKIVAQNSDLQQAVVTLSQLGLGLSDIAAAAAGNVQDLDRVVDTINSRIEDLKKQVEDADNAFDENGLDIGATEEQIKTLEKMRGKFKDAADQAKLTSDAMSILKGQTSATTDAAALLTPAEQALADAQKTLASASSTAQDKLDSLTKAQDVLRQSTIDGIEADEAWNSGLITLKQTIDEAKKAKDRDATSLSLHTGQGLRNRDMIENLIASADKMYDSDVALNGVTGQAIKKGQDHYKQIRDVAGQLGLSKKKTDDLIGAYGKIPKNVETAIGFKRGQFDKMFQQLEQAAFIQKGLKEGKDVDQVRAEYKQMISDRNRAKAHGWATGGPIAGPGISGGKTEDSNLIWASQGEFMQPAASVDYYGSGLMEAIRRRAIPREMFPGFASGGSVGGTQKWPFDMDISKTWIPNYDWLLTHTPGLEIADGNFTGLSPNATVAKMQRFALAQRGKRYLWSAVGPDRYDCSGLTGDLWAIATGHSLYHRYMSTGDMGPGRHGMVAGPGRYWTVYLGPGHTSSNISGLHAEAYGGNGTPLAIGRIGTPLSYYNQKLHLPGFADGGPIDGNALRTKKGRLLSFLQRGWPEPPRGMQMADLMSRNTFDVGGMLPPGISTVYNGTGRPEPVLTSDQWRTISDLAGRPAGSGATYQFQFRDTTLDESKLRALQTREAVMARYGRSR